MAREGGQQHKTTRKALERGRAARVCAQRRRSPSARRSSTTTSTRSSTRSTKCSSPTPRSSSAASSRRAASDVDPADAAACGLPDAGQLVVRRVPGRARTGSAARPACPAERAAAARGASRHDDRGRHVHRRRRDGRRPAGHDGQHHRPARHREGLPGRRVLVRRHRGCGRARRSRWSGCSRSSWSTTRRSRAAAVARRQGQPARGADPGQPGDGDAGPGRRAAVRRLRPGHAASAGSSPTT